ncbi:SMP-30/gluconolactonase/LRE family protein [soil metagenome]
MKNYLVFLVAYSITICISCKNQNATNTANHTDSTARKITIYDPEANKLIDSNAAVEIIAGGFTWTEGPLYVADGDYLLFSDIPANKIYKWKEGQDTSLFLTPSGNTTNPNLENEPGSNALLLNSKGELVLCQHGDRRIALMQAPLTAPKPQFLTLADKYEGKKLNSPNDAVYHANGDLYFTDPPYGLDKRIDDSTKELSFQGVYRLKPNGKLDVVTKELKYPNGIALSPDGKILYVASSDQANMIWMQYDLDSSGLPKSQHLFYEVHAFEGKGKGGPDGMKVDKQGYLFASGPEGLWIFNSAGKLLAKIFTGQATSNCAFSADQQTLFMTCDDYVMRVKLKQR